ncbi:MAG: class I mannose-6-phosphate isomerase [Kiritimatiellae bacterium]|nr:class I mannose-6-phosphate isomerase [Kiritimatiellia bacterium]
MTEPLYPYRFKPIYKDYIWGGDKIIKKFGRDEPPGTYAESWEVSDRPEGMSVVTNGELKGMTLNELVRKMGTRLLGPGHESDVFPLLVKLIDSRERLSVQVHPDDAMARKFGGEAKTEMWYILDAEPNAQVFAGLKRGVTWEIFEQALQLGLIEDLLVPVPVEQDDAIYIPGGRVHAIDSGCLILEVQQNSNTTYRIFDWHRAGQNGKPRPLHVQEALQVIRWNDDTSAKAVTRRLDVTGPNEEWEILTTPYFRMEKLVVSESWLLPTHHTSFQVLFVAEGRVEIRANGMAEDMPAGSTCLIPAALHSYEISPRIRPSHILRATATRG